MPDLLFVEDDPAFRSVIEHLLVAQGWRVRAVDSAEAAVTACAAQRPDLIVLDLMLPGRSGLDLCRQLQTTQPCPGIVMLTARGAESDVILGFEAGADDYVVKPCRPRELVARIQAVLRRLGVSARGATIERGRLRILPTERQVTVDEQVLQLTPTEFSLLLTLAAAPERVFSRMELLREVWDTSHPGYMRNVDCHVTRLRHKLGEAGLDPLPITTRHGLGYCFAAGANS